MRQYFRAYPARASRQQAADRLVHSEEDLRAVLWQAVDPAFEGERPSTIRLAADIYLTRPIELGAYDYNVVIEGDGRYRIGHTAGYTYGYIFGLPSGAEGVLTNVLFSGVTFFLNTANDIFGGSRSSKVHDFNIKECTVESDSLSVVPSSRIFDTTTEATSSLIQIDEFTGILLGGAKFTGIYEAGGVEGIHFTPTLYHFRENNLIFSRSQNGVRCGTGNTLDMSLRVDGGARILNHDITLTGNNPYVNVGNRSFLNITIDNATATGTMSMSYGVPGQILVLYFNNSSSNMVLDDTVSINVNKNNHAKKPVADETVTFIYINGKWQELCRSENT